MPEHPDAWRIVAIAAQVQVGQLAPREIADRDAVLTAICQALLDLRNFKADA